MGPEGPSDVEDVQTLTLSQMGQRPVGWRETFDGIKTNLLNLMYMSTATITAADINKLRQTTGAGMMDCRKALVESDGDFEKAIDYLRKKGQKVAALRSDREAKEGVIIATTTADNKTGFIVTVACETDFVAKNADFVAFARSIAAVAVKNDMKTWGGLLG